MCACMDSPAPVVYVHVQAGDHAQVSFPIPLYLVL